MKALFFIILTLFLGSCQQKGLDTAVYDATQRLSELAKNKISDTIVLKQALDSAFQSAQRVSDRKLDSLFAVVSKQYGNQFFMSKPAEARAIYHQAIKIGLRQFTIHDDCIVRLYKNIATTYYNANDYKNAIMYFDSVKVIGLDSAAQVLKAQTLVKVAECYMGLNDLKSAENIFKEGEPLAQKYLPSAELVYFYKWYSSCLRLLKKYHKAIEKAKLGLLTIKTNVKNKVFSKNDSFSLAKCHFSIAYALQDSGSYKAAEQQYLIALAMFKHLNDWDSYKRGLNNMGINYRFDKQFDKAEKTLTTGINLFGPSALNDDSIRLKASFYVNRSEVYLATKNDKKALADHDSAIYFFTQYDKNPTLTAIMRQARPVLLSVLTDKAKVYAALAEKGADTEGYQKALKLTDQIVELADDIRADYFSDDAKLSLANDLKPALEKAISLCQSLYKQTKNAAYLQKAFDFVEYSRSMVLYENARLANQLPADLIAENDALKVQEAALISKNDVEALQKYMQHKRQFREKIKALNKNKLADMATLQTHLLPDTHTAFIEYFVGDSTIFVFLLLKNDLKTFEIKKNKDFDQQIDTFRKGITQAKPVRDATAFGKQSAALYDILLRSPLSALPPSVSKLIIAPDGVLSYLPFEILTPSVTNADFRQIDFLLTHFAISYAYSANLLLMQKQTKRHETPYLFASFVPKYETDGTNLIAANISSKIDIEDMPYRDALSRQGLLDLQGAADEVIAINTVIGGKTFKNDSATEGSFKSFASQFRILHLAMHAKTDDNDPMLSHLLFTSNQKDVTEDGDLTAAELYAMRLNADLAVLSACNTGFGTLSKGEGVMSLARAFTYAGVPATVTSLWKAPDLTTPQIMEAFYKNLKEGMRKEEALRQAKLTYLKTAPESVAANPYLWASFVPMGNMDAMDLTEKGPLSRLWLLLGLGVLIGVIGFFFGKKHLFSIMRKKNINTC